MDRRMRAFLSQLVRRSLNKPRAMLGRFARDCRGVSALEFAILLPLLLSLYLGGTEISSAIGIQRKVTLTARTVADLVGQVTKVTDTDMTNVLDASSLVIAPYDPGDVAITVSLITIDASSKATVAWSDTRHGTARTKGDVIKDIPTALVTPNTSLVWGEVSYNYKPAIGYAISGTITLKDKIYIRPRLSDTITRSKT